MEAADSLTLQRNDVIDLVLNAGCCSQLSGLFVQRSNGSPVNFR